MNAEMTDDAALSRCVADWAPPATDTYDAISVDRVRELANALNMEQHAAEGGFLPPLWQWGHFLEWVPTRELGADGHPRTGHFLPPIPNRRRMFAGGRVEMALPLVIGEMAVRRSTLVRKVVKRGRSGEMLFVTVQHEYRQGNQLRVREEQDLVYRSDASAPALTPPAGEPLGEQTAPWAVIPEVNSTLLFRFSAATGNAHRIHYDEAYTTEVEGFPALVVHGPLLAILLAELARSNGGVLRTFDFRFVRPVFVTDLIRLEGTPSRDGRSAELAVVSGSGSVHATAVASFA